MDTGFEKLIDILNVVLMRYMRRERAQLYSDVRLERLIFCMADAG